MTRTWTIKPLRGAGDIAFGMAPDAVAALLGPPDKVKSGIVSVRREYRALDMPMINYDEHGVSEITFGRFADVALDGMLVFQQDAAAILRHLAARDTALLESHGIIIARAAGVTITGFHDGDEDQKTITAFKDGVWHAGNLADAKPIRFF
jgi:hypothetical protein